MLQAIGAFILLVICLSRPVAAGMPYGSQAYGTGWYGYGSAELILDRTSIVIPEGTSTQLVLHVSTQPPRSQTVTVYRVSGDSQVGLSGTTNFVFTTNNWNQNQAITITTAVDIARVDGTAIVQCAALEISATNVVVLRSGLLGTSDADVDGVANINEYIAGSSWLDPMSAEVTATISGAPTNTVVSFSMIPATGPDYVGKTRHYRLDSRTNLTGGAWSPVPGATNITGSGPYQFGTNSIDKTRYYRVRVWLTTP